MKMFQKINNLLGWLMFLISAVVYLLTIESSASFWDCGEFITSAFKLEVGHPPGAPVFMLLGRLFTLFGGGAENAAYMMNLLSGLLSAFTILFLFWTITHLGRRIAGNPETYTPVQWISVMGSGVIGALVYTFSDTFWFSAVEAEVYAFSSFLTAIVVWAMLKWENVADEPHANRWLVLIAYIMGLSIGVHLLNLLAIPALGLIYYYRKYQPTTAGLIKALFLSFVILGVTIWVLIPGVFSIATKFELLFVNSFGLPFNIGEAVWFLLLASGLIFGIFYSIRHQKVLLNHVLLCISVLIIGYSSYAVIVIRSSANPPMDQNDPQDPFKLLYYLNREQYGDRPLFRGATFNAPVIGTKQGKPVYAKRNGRYEVVDHKVSYEYDPRFLTLFPRMYDNQDPRRADEYKAWGNIKGTPIQAQNLQGKMETVMKPTFAENIRFFISYQVNWMYFRYFMWNFAGRQNDLQGHGDPLRGNWISGISFLDELRLGPQDELPTFLAENKGRNTYFFLPLILGLMGLFFHSSKNRGDFYMVLMLFFMTGLAIVLYLNQYPLQPRERDYAYAGSFYAFSIWIGLGFMAAIESFPKRWKQSVPVTVLAFLLLFSVPLRMAAQNWDDHDRSGRTFCRDFGANYLESCAPNAVIFTNGDNDTFPLWYAQEVEGVRTDVRVVNLSYFMADWYIEQMQRKAYESEPLLFSLKPEQFQTGKRETLEVFPVTDAFTELKLAIDFVASEDPKTKTIPGVAEKVEYFPVRNLKITVDSTAVINTGTLSPELAPRILKTMTWSLPEDQPMYGGRILLKSSFMLLDLLANNNWKRPLYMSTTVADENYLGLQKFFQVEGLAYRIVPIETPRDSVTGDLGRVNTEVMYNNLMNKFSWGGVEGDVYIDETVSRLLSNARNWFSRLAEALIDEGDSVKAIEVLDRSLALFPSSKVPHNFLSPLLIEQYYRAGAFDKGNQIVAEMIRETTLELAFYGRFNRTLAPTVDRDRRIAFYVLNLLAELAQEYKQDAQYKEIEKIFEMFYTSIN